MSLRTKLLSTSALAVAGTFWLGASPALAIPAGSCVTGGAASAITITCSGTVPYNVSTADDNTTITLNADAHVSATGETAIGVYDENSSLVMGANSSAYSSGNGATNAVRMNSNGNVTLNGAASIDLVQNNLTENSYALHVNEFDGTNITLNGGSTISFTGGGTDDDHDGYGAGGIEVFGEKNKITLNGASAINVTGNGTGVANNYIGISLTETAETAAARNTVTLNDGSSINVTRTGTNTYGHTMGIRAGAVDENKYAADITLNSSAVTVSAAGVSSGEKYLGIFNVGAAATVTLNDSQISVTGSSANDDNKYMGVVLFQSNLSNALTGGLTLKNGSSIVVNANGSGENAIIVGATVINSYGDTQVGPVTLDGGSTITLNANADTSIMAGLLSKGYKSAVELSGGSRVEINAYGAGSNGKYMGIFAVETSETADGAGTITLNAGSSVAVYAGGGTNNKYIGVAGFSAGGGKYASDMVMNDSTVTINAAGSGVSKYVGGFLFGNDQNTTLNGTSKISVNTWSLGIGYAVGLLSAGDTGNAVTLNDTSGVELNAVGLQRAFGVGVYSDDASLILNDASHIDIDAGYTEVVQGAMVMGESVTVALNGSSYIHIDANYSNYMTGLFVSAGVSKVTLGGSSSISVSADRNKYVAAGIWTEGGHAAVTLNGSAEVDVSGENAEELVGIRVQDGDSTVEMNGTSRVGVNGVEAGSVMGMRLTGDNNTITLNGSALVEVGGDHAEYAAGILSSGDYASIVMNGDSRVAVGLDADVENAKGIRISGYGSSVTLNDNASVAVNSYSSGNRLGGIVLNGEENMSVTLNDHANVTTTGYGAIAGIYVRDVDNSSITLNGFSSVNAGYGIGIQLHQSDDNTVTVASGASVYGGTGIKARGNFNVLDISGTVTGTNTLAIDMRNGSNGTLILNSATINGGIRGGGSGTDHLVLQGAGLFAGTVRDFGDLTVDGSGIWNLTNTIELSDDVNINSGKLAINGTLTTDEVTVHSGGILGGSGTITGAITVLAGGTVSPGNSPGTLNVVGPVTFNSGSFFDVEIGASAADLLNATGAVTIDPGAVVNPVFLAGADGFVGDIVTGASVTGTFIAGSGAALDYSTPGAVSLTAASSSSMNGAVSAATAQGFTFLDTVLNEAQKSAAVGKTLWGTALWSKSTRTATASSRDIDQHADGGAFGGDVMDSGDFSLGLAAGYLDGDAITSGGGSRTSIEGYHAAVYSTYTFGGTYLTSAVTAAYQNQNAKRNVFAGGVLVGAQGSPEAWLGGVGVGIGHEFPLNGAFTITPRASLGYQHMARDGYTENGGGAGALALDDINTDTVRGRVGAELALNVADKNAMWKVRPSVNAALAQEWREGDTTTTGTFRTTGAAFNNDLDTRDQTYLAVGAGVDVTIGHGVTAFVNYDGGFGGDAERIGGWRLGARMEW